MINNLSWKRQTLSNNLRFLLYPKPSALTAQLSVAIEYGSNSDSKSKAGTAHLIEHMLAGGSLERIEHSRSIEIMGGSIEYSTSHEDTMIITDIVPDKIEETSKILSQQLLDSAFEEKNFKSEKKIIMNEIAEALDDPWTTLEETLRKNLFKNHPVRLPVLGLRKTVDSLSLDDIKEAYRTNYVPESMILILTGKFSNKDADTVLKEFSKLTPEQKPLKNTHYAENDRTVKETTIPKAGITQTYLSIGSRTVSAKHSDVPALKLIEILMGEGASSRLFIELRDKNALTYTIGSQHEYGSDFGYFHVDCSIKGKNLQKTTKLIHGEIAKMRNENVSEDELKKGKAIIMADVLRAIDSSHGLPLALASLEMQFNNKNALVDYVKRIQEVSAKDISEAANKYLNEENLSSAILTPKTL